MQKILAFTLVLITQCSLAQDTIRFYLHDERFFKISTIKDGFKVEFVDSLPDGVYIQYDVEQKDSLTKSKNIIAIGQFKHRVKEGPFEFNRYNYVSKKVARLTQQRVCSYHKGEKNGIEEEYAICYFVFPCKVMLFQGYYSNGKKDGLFLYYESGSVVKAQVFYNDELQKEFHYSIWLPK